MVKSSASKLRCQMVLQTYEEPDDIYSFAQLQNEAIYEFLVQAANERES